MNKKNVFLNLLSVYGMTFPQGIKSTESQKLDYNDKVIVNIDTEKLVTHDEMNVFCEAYS
jgi:hypothetical protein